MTAPHRACQCPVHPGQPCDAAITAEDLLCDICREAGGGCSVMWFNGVLAPCHGGRLEYTYQLVTGTAPPPAA